MISQILHIKHDFASLIIFILITGEIPKHTGMCTLEETVPKDQTSLTAGISGRLLTKKNKSCWLIGSAQVPLGHPICQQVLTRIQFQGYYVFLQLFLVCVHHSTSSKKSNGCIGESKNQQQ